MRSDPAMFMEPPQQAAMGWRAMTLNAGIILGSQTRTSSGAMDSGPGDGREPDQPEPPNALPSFTRTQGRDRGGGSGPR